MAKVTKEMGISELAEKYPDAIPVLMKNGMHCIGCMASQFENIEQGAKAHGMDDDKIKKMMDEINDVLEKGSK
ncbi:MAG: DUF1858 domain-containing protein [Candidatus Woesearchaeota archaeon]|jgi:hybrid cluster-associated redox disulfide protein|nr:DUF1858 domain-containing protein [Candidatus Woesearchaeota archaeon]